MENNEKKEDRRVRRTKKLLMQGLIELIQQKPIKDISVRELAELVDVNRGTFYLYYKDIFDMLEQLENDMFEKFDQIILSHQDETVIDVMLPFLRDLFQFVCENKELCHVLLSENGDMAFFNKMNQVVREKCLNDWLKLHKKPDDTKFDYRYTFVMSGCMGLVRAWVERNCSEPTDEMAALADQMIRQGALTGVV